MVITNRVNGFLFVQKVFLGERNVLTFFRTLQRVHFCSALLFLHIFALLLHYLHIPMYFFNQITTLCSSVKKTKNSWDFCYRFYASWNIVWSGMVENILVQYKTVDASFNKACNVVYLTALFCFIIRNKHWSTGCLCLFSYYYTHLPSGLQAEALKYWNLLLRVLTDQIPQHISCFVPSFC